MNKDRFLYFFIAIVTVALIALGWAMGSTLFKKPVKPAPIYSPAVITPEPESIPAEPEEMPALPQEAPVVAEAPAVVEAPIVAEAPEVVRPTVEAPVLKPEFHKGMIYVAWTGDGYSNVNSLKAMEQMRSLGVEWVGLVTTWYQEQYNSSEIHPLRDKTPSDNSLIFAIRKLHELKFKIMLKPHLDLIKSDGKWRGDIRLDSPQDWQKWFDSYSAFIMHYVNIAAQENVELLCIGTELTQATFTQPQYWRDLINKIRQTYNGALTYAANWHEEFSQIEFWDALDYAGIDPYFPLVCTMNPQVEELKSAWLDWAKMIEAWQQEINKPVIFTEIGYKSSSDATDEPWQHVGVGKLDLELQVNCYQALLESFWDKPWFYGAYWWYWGVHPKMGGKLNKGFTPQNKPAQEVIKEWYTNKAVSQKNY